MKYQKLNENCEYLAAQIVDSAYKVHRSLGPGLLEMVYQECFCHELKKHSLPFQKQLQVPIVYDGLHFQSALRLDVLVADLIICELKAIDQILPVHKAQLLSYLKLTNRRLGFLINFHVPLIRTGIHRIIL